MEVPTLGKLFAQASKQASKQAFISPDWIDYGRSVMKPPEETVREIVRALKIDEESLRTRRSFLEFTDADAARLSNIHPHLSSLRPQFVDDFYRHLTSFEETRRFLPDDAAVERLKKAQSDYFDSLTAGIYDTRYVHDRLKIGAVHQAIGLSPQWYLGAYVKYLSGLLPEIRNFLPDQPDEFLAVWQSLIKVAMFDMSLALDAYIYADIKDIRILKEYAEKVFSSIPDGILVLSRSLTVLSANRAFLKQFGLSADTIFGRPLEQVLQASGLKEQILEVIGTGDMRHDLLLSVGIAGEATLKPMRITLAGMRLAEEEEEEEAMVLVIVEDLTEEERLRALAESSERRFRELAETAYSGIVLVNSGMRVVYFNGAAEKMFGCDRTHVLDQPLAILLPEAGTLFPDPLKEGESRICDSVGQRLDKSLFPMEISASVFAEPSGSFVTLVLRDLTERKTFESQLLYLANYDALTGLPNRTHLIDRLKQAIHMAERNGQHLALLFLDLDRFKGVNDSLGHASGDTLLVEMSKRLANCVRKGDTVARFGGDEFVFLLEGLEERLTAEPIAKKILDELNQPFMVDNVQVFMNGSIGISTWPHDGESSDLLLRRADAAMYRAKELGNSYAFYNPEIGALPERRFSMERELRLALERNEFELFYQPQIDLLTGNCVGAEALIRWRHPEKGLILPDQFIPVAESTGLIVPIGAWVIRSACLHLKSWREAGLAPLRLTVNVSVKQFERGGVTQTVESSLKEFGVDGRFFEIEVTESVLMQHPMTAANLRELSLMGILISIDDFGTGYSSLSYLKKLPVYKLKIDRSFVTTLPVDPDIRAIATAIITMGSALRLKTIAEGVESREQLDILRELGCDEIQGYYYSRPLPNDEFMTWVREKSTSPRA